jgi:hypothetical protein
MAGRGGDVRCYRASLDKPAGEPFYVEQGRAGSKPAEMWIY